MAYNICDSEAIAGKSTTFGLILVKKTFNKGLAFSQRRYYAKNEGGEKSAKKSGKILIFLKILLWDYLVP